MDRRRTKQFRVFFFFLGLGFRDSGGSGFRVLGVQGLGCRGLGVSRFRGLGVEGSGFRVQGKIFWVSFLGSTWRFVGSYKWGYN